MHIVADVNAVHESIVVTYACSLLVKVAAGYDHVFTNKVVIANSYVEGSSFLEVNTLWHGANHGILEDAIVAAHTRAVKQRGTWINNTIVANDYVLLDVYKGIYFYVLPELCAGFNYC